MSDPQNVRSIRGQIARKVTFRILVANAISAFLVVVYLSLVAVGNTGLRTTGDAISLVVTLAYLSIVFPAAAVRARRSTARLLWVEADRTPTPEERTEALRLPATLASGFDQGTLPSRSRGNRHVQGDFGGQNRRNPEVIFCKIASRPKPLGRFNSPEYRL